MATPLPNSPEPASVLPSTRSALRPLHLWHLASLDAPTVAVVWTLGFAWAAGVRLPEWVLLLVALVVWPVYVADRLLDARSDLARAELGRLRERHLFHWRHRRWLVPLAAMAAAIAGAILLGWVPAVVRARDSLLGAAALAYFTRVHAPESPGGRWQRVSRWRGMLTKELLVGLLFTAGCVLPAWSRAQAAGGLLATPAVVFALLAWLNCTLIDGWESGTTTKRRFIGLALGLAAVALAVAVLAASQPRIALLLGAASLAALLLAALDSWRSRLAPVTLRALADLVLLTPLLAMGMAASIAR